ncbi:hypothetical protein O181_034135 [Austropuccinia psidii MF-1]|uniref:Reverse transcriptase/retrotransposon-derived protein RNase H-like domain-containing protein n=1 Tax=Austropuccinia psidii MF-1 TaxID=1389203 RepID=A0A9Q3D4B0_9BASI|nr:hypothetical protein [Austropuccinia psidii MF-1]
MIAGRVKAFQSLRHTVTTPPILLMPDAKLPLKINIDASGYGLGPALHQVQIINQKHVKGPLLSYLGKSNLLNPDMEKFKWNINVFFGNWKKFNYFLEGFVFEAVIDCTAVKSPLNMKKPNRNILRWQIGIQEYRGNMTILHKY